MGLTVYLEGHTPPFFGTPSFVVKNLYLEA